MIAQRSPGHLQHSSRVQSRTLDRRHVFSMNYVYELPFFTDQRIRG